MNSQTKTLYLYQTYLSIYLLLDHHFIFIFLPSYHDSTQLKLREMSEEYDIKL